MTRITALKALRAMMFDRRKTAIALKKKAHPTSEAKARNRAARLVELELEISAIIKALDIIREYNAANEDFERFCPSCENVLAVEGVCPKCDSKMATQGAMANHGDARRKVR